MLHRKGGFPLRSQRRDRHGNLAGSFAETGACRSDDPAAAGTENGRESPQDSGLPQHQLAVGEPADLTLVDLDYHWTVDPEKMHSKAKNVIWKGKTLVGKPVCTITEASFAIRIQSI